MFQIIFAETSGHGDQWNSKLSGFRVVLYPSNRSTQKRRRLLALPKTSQSFQ
jgi:hypothetical protein